MSEVAKNSKLEEVGNPGQIREGIQRRNKRELEEFEKKIKTKDARYFKELIFMGKCKWHLSN